MAATDFGAQRVEAAVVRGEQQLVGGLGVEGEEGAVTFLELERLAAEILQFTKATRLNLTAGLLEEIRRRTLDEQMSELEYMANTIPSSWEFVDYVFCIEGVSRAYTHQQVRTRAASYAQQTMRVLDMGKFDYVFTDNNLASPKAMEIIEAHQKITQEAYRMLIDAGQAPEDARGILPTNIATNIVCKFNLRTLAELARSRTGGRTHVKVNGVEYRSVREAFKALGLPDSKHIKFRMELKAAGKKSFDGKVFVTVNPA